MCHFDMQMRGQCAFHICCTAYCTYHISALDFVALLYSKVSAETAIFGGEAVMVVYQHGNSPKRIVLYRCYLTVRNSVYLSD